MDRAFIVKVEPLLDGRPTRRDFVLAGVVKIEPCCPEILLAFSYSDSGCFGLYRSGAPVRIGAQPVRYCPFCGARILVVEAAVMECREEEE